MKKKTVVWLGLILVVIVAAVAGIYYFTLPPKIPHAITEGMDCKSCHATGANGAPISSHINKPNCVSCHKTK
ncbi:hypothetical protein REC12_19255 [Desulfosporosinus sp. PR]|uniref:hypothetical protein n=1 Tax=Candidatus Desulfosporosinus nitrosoreducens TaxID=3401928 RepID=UPI0027EB659A|nr:hypothetical protein [Desulfosporosinus sp. PR]MDQ7095732.1 hypothetical protein [Desulfosporosinus sp. PR]